MINSAGHDPPVQPVLQPLHHARRRKAAKRRSENGTRVTLDNALAAIETNTIDLMMLEDALNRLAERSARQAKIVEPRLFGGLTIDETAHVLGVGRTTVVGDWTIDKAWLKRELLGHTAS
jgi:RNA polymerase sigma-70 factor (ECF subfamily)